MVEVVAGVGAVAEAAGPGKGAATRCWPFSQLQVRPRTIPRP